MVLPSRLCNRRAAHERIEPCSLYARAGEAAKSHASAGFICIKIQRWLVGINARRFLLQTCAQLPKDFVAAALLFLSPVPLRLALGAKLNRQAKAFAIVAPKESPDGLCAAQCKLACLTFNPALRVVAVRVHAATERANEAHHFSLIALEVQRIGDLRRFDLAPTAAHHLARQA